MAIQPEMPHTGHEKHMCYLVNIGFHTHKPEEFKELVRDPKFYCRSCGRVAHDKSNLCTPEPLEPGS